MPDPIVRVFDKTVVAKSVNRIYKDCCINMGNLFDKIRKTLKTYTYGNGLELDEDDIDCHYNIGTNGSYYTVNITAEGQLSKKK